MQAANQLISDDRKFCNALQLPSPGLDSSRSLWLSDPPCILVPTEEGLQFTAKFYASA